jgi:hypothetical protein
MRKGCNIIRQAPTEVPRSGAPESNNADAERAIPDLISPPSISRQTLFASR